MQQSLHRAIVVMGLYLRHLGRFCDFNLHRSFHVVNGGPSDWIIVLVQRRSAKILTFELAELHFYIEAAVREPDNCFFDIGEPGAVCRVTGELQATRISDLSEVEK